MSEYLALTGDAEQAKWYSMEEDCEGHLVGTLDALRDLLRKNEPAKHFLTRGPLNSAEEYAQAVGWEMLRRS